MIVNWVKIDTKVYGLNPKFQRRADFEITISWLLEVIPAKKLPELNIRPVWMNYGSIKLFSDLCFEVCQELAVNINDIEKTDLDKYVKCHSVLKKCIDLFYKNSEIMVFDMSFLINQDEAYFSYSENWYKLVYDQLKIVDSQFSRMLLASPNQKEASGKKPSDFSYNVYAMALSLKNITLNKEGKGVNDGIDYAKKFELKSGKSLYNKLNGIENLANPDKFKIKANEVIKKYKL
jgi:hypothetical protein